jgi:NAD+ synthetase
LDDIKIRRVVGPIINNAVNAGIQYVKDNPKIKAFVLGVSGGLDSAVVAALARMICDKTDVKLLGFSLPIHGNKTNEVDRSIEVGMQYCDVFSKIDIDDDFHELLYSMDRVLYRKYINQNSEISQEEKIRCGNIKARLRMIYLYNLASKHNGLVLSTDNLTESLLGFWTLHGDVGDLGLIQNLWKSEVYNIGQTIDGSCQLCVDAVPTDGLGITHSDLDQILPEWTPKMGDHIDAYRFVDDTLINLLNGANAENAITQRYEATKFKRANPTNITREALLRKEETNEMH